MIPADSNLRRALTITERVIPIRSAITDAVKRPSVPSNSPKIADTAFISEYESVLIAMLTAVCLRIVSSRFSV